MLRCAVGGFGLGLALAFAPLAALPVSAQPVQQDPVPMPPPPIGGALPEPLGDADVQMEAQQFQAALRHDVPHQIHFTPALRARMIGLAQAQAALAGFMVDHPQLVVVVDRNPNVQALAIVLARPDAPWAVLGGTHVSTGQPNRKLYYITPTGVFLHTTAILDYRAEGTFNENHIRGLGLKGMRVWDFGWQWARKGWLQNGEQGQIRLEMHATDPEFLEQRLGRPASEGCIRIPAALNVFMDREGVLDQDYEQMAAADPRYRALLASDRQPTKLAGHALIIVDSNGTP